MGGSHCALAIFSLSIFALCSYVQALDKGPELLTSLNPDLEINYNDPGFTWRKNKGCSFVTVSDAHTGEKSLKVSSRTSDAATPRLKLRNDVLLSGHSYFYSAYVKFLNNPTGFSHFNVSLMMKVNTKGEKKQHVSTRIGDLKYQRAGTGWQQVGGDFRMPTLAERNYGWAMFYLQFPQEVDFLFDSNTLYELVQPDPDQWLININTKIQKERTSLITITANTPPEYEPTNMEIKVVQESRPFRFGAGVRVNDFVRNSTEFNDAYRAFFYENFDMAVLMNAMKWKAMVFKKDNYKRKRVDTFLDMMASKKIPVRAHTILWGKYETQPHWLLDYIGYPNVNKTVLRNQINIWIDWVCDNYNDMHIQWDVYNEYLHAQMYEYLLEDEEFLLGAFDRVAERCTGGLYTNDYEILRGGSATVAQLNMARWLLAEGKPLAGIGAQTHILDYHFDRAHIELMEHRLELLCSLGLPVMITELSVQHGDISVRAKKLDQVLRLVYSEPCVESVIHWGYSDVNNADPDMELAVGATLQRNEAGDVWHSLTREEWKTHETILPSTNQLSETFSGHHGDYSVTVNHNGNPIVTSSFTLTKGQDVTHDIVFPQQPPVML